MITLPMREDGPDRRSDRGTRRRRPGHQGHMRVPVYSNPTGTTYSWETVGRLVLLRLLILCHWLVGVGGGGRCRVTDGTAARADHGQEHSAVIVFLIMIKSLEC
jgi:hypothetical protein